MKCWFFHKWFDYTTWPIDYDDMRVNSPELYIELMIQMWKPEKFISKKCKRCGKIKEWVK